ncbi:MAG: response regulator [Candidatus Aminicenantes bacterium]|nr:response regulator [Candidatus Aminicenantes bacterium]
MDAKNGEFLKRLRETFRIEAEEHVRALSTGLIELEKTTDAEKQAHGIETMFREAHSLKGAARSVNLADIESLCQALESVFAALKRQEIALQPTLLDLLHQTVDGIARLVPSADAEGVKTGPAYNGELACQLDKAAKGLPLAAKPENNVPQPRLESPLPQAETVRIPIAKLDPLLLQAEEMLSAKMAAGQRAAELQEINRALSSWKAESGKWQDRHSPGQDRAGLPEWNEERLGALQSRVAATTKAVEQDQRALKHMVDDHLQAMKELLLLPLASVVEILPKLVRDLARAQGKEVELTIQGADIEIDKRILEELKDPLVHLVRNGVDHGIKKPEERTREGKPPCGAIRLSFVAKDNRQLGITVADDGSGIDLNKVRAAAAKLGLRQTDAKKWPDPEETLQLIFHSGISTSPIITDISGRGLGLAIVREKVEKLGGTVSVESQTGAGTTFRLLLPMTLATFRGVLVQASAQLFVLPTMNVERVLRVRKEDIKTVENRETIKLDGQILPMARLRDTLALPLWKNGLAWKKAPGRPESSTMPIMVLTSAEKRMGFLVDEVLQEQEVLVKGLGAQLKRVRNIAGATILGNGRVVPVLNVHDLMKSAVSSAAVTRKEAVTETTPVKTGRILVAEDSITSRTLLKNILEIAGYQVATAVDGVDAFSQLRSQEFDLLVSDVDMPRMSGFELTTKIRADKKLGELPVVLVTALESRADKERGIEAGANAYIIKSSFDQSNLLEVLRRFL